MRYIPRELADVLRQATRHFPAVVVTGPRRAGKTTLLRELFPAAQYVLLEDPDIQGRVRSDPRAFIEGIRPPAQALSVAGLSERRYDASVGLRGPLVETIA